MDTIFLLFSFLTGMAQGASSPIPSPTSTPIVIDNKSNQIIKGVNISNYKGDCIVIQNNSKNIQILDSQIGPCSGAAIKIMGSQSITVKNVTMTGATGNSVDISTSDHIMVYSNNITGGQSGVYAYLSTRVKVQQNQFLNVQGPRPRGNYVQFNRVTGTGNNIVCNYGMNVQGQSFPEDSINLYQSNGVVSYPIKVFSNRIQGGGPSTSGGGIILGDGGGSFQTAQDNRLVNPGNYGVAVAGGNNQKLINNQVFSVSTPVSNVGLYVWNQYSTPCSAITVNGNKVYWFNKAGVLNGSWNGGNCQIKGWNSNNFNAAGLTPAALMSQVPPSCANGAILP